MVHHSHNQDSGDAGSSSTPDSPDADAPERDESARGRGTAGMVEAGWLRPHAYRALGHPRVSTIILLIVWIALLVLYLEVSPH
ncbi:hypothetical protein [Nocardia alni]|uniref:hypothetical protein n=1 Tax=Nocardia alni TaxID=2815723 RepID=UPI001C236859|nr:hypothetical protein [Nocardia alni]